MGGEAALSPRRDLDLDSLWVTATQDVPQLDKQLAGIERTEREPSGSADET
jgi:hypothetical protein